MATLSITCSCGERLLIVDRADFRGLRVAVATAYGYDYATVVRREEGNAAALRCRMRHPHLFAFLVHSDRDGAFDESESARLVGVLRTALAHEALAYDGPRSKITHFARNAPVGSTTLTPYATFAALAELLAAGFAHCAAARHTALFM